EAAPDGGGASDRGARRGPRIARRPMTTLPEPIREVLDGRVDEATLRRMWHNIDSPPARRRRFFRRLRTWPIALAVPLAISLIGAGLLLGRDPRSDAGISFANGDPFDMIASGDREQISAKLSDGSALTLAPSTSMLALENGAHTVVVLFEKG